MTLALPGLDTATVGEDGWYETARVGLNEWALAVGPPPVRAALLAGATARTRPSIGDGTLARHAAAVLRIELDVCGAWVTAAAQGGLRSVVVRRAGWVDLRGHGRGTPGEDRVGLGPGDALVVTPAPADEDRLLDCLLRVTGEACPVIAAGTGLPRAAVLSVPEGSAEEAMARVEAATGVSRDRLQLPGYPLGDQQPDLWHEPPTPPREARLRLHAETAGIAGVRRLLRRLLASWRLDSLVDEGDIELLATETATNAVRHAGTDATVIVRYLGDRVRVEVGDGSRALPRTHTPALDESGGRGMSLVEALSSSWGVTETFDGKRVWFEVAAKPSPRR